MGSRLDDLIAKAKAKHTDQKATQSKVRQKDIDEVDKPHKTKVESTDFSETNLFDNLEDDISAVSTSAIPMNVPDEDIEFQVGDPVVGLHNNQRMAGQVIEVSGDNVIVEWKNHDVTRVKADKLELSNVDDDYEEQTMYIESAVQPNMGFDKESFVEDTDLQSLLSGRDGDVDFKYGASYDL